MKAPVFHKFKPSDKVSFFRFSGRLDSIHLNNPDTSRPFCNKPCLSSNYAEDKPKEGLCKECEKGALAYRDNKINNKAGKGQHQKPSNDKG